MSAPSDAPPLPPSSAPTTNSAPASQTADLDIRAFQDVIQNIVHDALGGMSRKRGRNGDDDEGTENTPSSETPVSSTLDYTGYGRTFTRICDPYTKVDAIVQHGIQIELLDSADEREITPKEKKLDDSWNIICSFVPGFRESMVCLAGKRSVRRSVSRQIGKGAEGARSDDTGSLKLSVVSYLLEDPTETLEPSLPLRDKTFRGWAHPATAELLCPLEYPCTAANYADIQAGSKSIHADQLPRFLFPFGQENVPEAYDVILRGPLMIRVAKHILIGPSAALKGPGHHRGRSGNAALMGISAVTPRCIAYIAVQARFALTSMHEWSRNDGTFDYPTFFWNIVAMFDNKEGDDILAFYNHQVFGTTLIATSQPEAQSDAPSHATEVSHFELMRAQRATNKVRTAQAAAPLSGKDWEELTTTNTSTTTTSPATATPSP